MGKWLAKFSANIQESRTDIADIVPTLSALSALSVPHIEIPSQTTPTPPLQPGWRVVYSDHQGRLTGGSDDPDHGTVKVCRWDARAWTVTLTDGQTMRLSRVRSVGAVDHKGRLFGAWAVKEHGYDGAGPVTRRGQS